ncbi:MULTISPECIES: hypothetical protein [unclassified Nocardiopsis]
MGIALLIIGFVVFFAVVAADVVALERRRAVLRLEAALRRERD